jgi:hypothetical protein
MNNVTIPHVSQSAGKASRCAAISSGPVVEKKADNTEVDGALLV